MPDLGDPIAFTALPEGVPAYAHDGEEVGRVARVLADEATGMFDGIALDTAGGRRFVDAPEGGDLGTRGAEVRLSAAAIDALPEPTGEQDPGGGLRGVWSRITGR